MSEEKQYEVRVTGYATVIVSGKNLSADAALLAAKTDMEADADFAVTDARVMREINDGDIVDADILLDVDAS